MPTFDIYFIDIEKETGRIFTNSYYVNAPTWEAVEAMIPATHWVSGKVISIEDEDSGVIINLDNLN